MSRKRRFKPQGARGTFLIEFLIAISVMSILAFGTYVSVYPQVVKAQDAKTKVDLNSVRSAFQEYYDDQYCFPTALPTCGTELKVGTKTYFKNFPCNSDHTSYTYETDNTSCPHWYKITTNLKNNNDQSIDAVHCREGCGPVCQNNYGVSANIRLNYGCPLVFPTPSIVPTGSPTPNPSPTGSQELYACSPSGQCIRYSYPDLSECPKIYVGDTNCMNECVDSINRCKNERGKKPSDQ
ncbi:MAG: hypothetical protein A2152_02765 [Candidatus Levybacteria bacterium RBG_16_35_6]|nr:MAG: hypothetical protein A2152_02765 [Candidatus Levybacteria bacterium RBG_16_35_6]